MSGMIGNATEDTGAAPNGSRRAQLLLLAGIGAATAAAHLGNNFTTYLIGGLIDRYGFTPAQMGVWSMTELLAFAVSMFLVAPRVASLSPRWLMMAAGVMVAWGKFASAGLSGFAPLLAGRIATGFGFGLANTALNLAASRTRLAARAVSVGIAFQTALYTVLNLVLPQVGARHGVGGMFVALGAVVAVLTLSAVWLPDAAAAPVNRPSGVRAAPMTADSWRVIAAMALFSFGSLAIWPFVERTAHAIGLSAVAFGRYQSLATLACATSNVVLAIVVARLRVGWALAAALLVCGLSCAALTTVASAPAFATALVLYNVSWLLVYPLIIGIACMIDPGGRLSVLCSGTWLLTMALGSLITGLSVQKLGAYTLVGPFGLLFCIAAIIVVMPLALRSAQDRADVL